MRRSVWLPALVVGFATTAPEAIVGRWLWVDRQTLLFRPEGKVEGLQSGAVVREGAWKKLDVPRRYQVTWVKGAIQVFEVSADGFTITSATPEGTPQRGERMEEERP